MGIKITSNDTKELVMNNLDHITSLAELVQVAVDDTLKVKADPRYTFDVDVWHHFNDGKCSVCVAGAVISNTLGAPLREPVLPGYFGARIKNLLLLLNEIREGDIPHISKRLDSVGIDVDFKTLKLAFRNLDLLAGDMDEWQQLAHNCKRLGL